MDDVIYRQDAIDAIKEFKHGAAEWRDEQEERSDIWHRADSAIASAIEIGLRVKKIPSARKQGKWVVVTRHEHYPSEKPYEQLQCPFCKRFDHNGDGNFCGYCGADMRGGKSELFNQKISRLPNRVVDCSQ